ncbi:retrotransposon protein, putative, ty1-copia subclass [Tanacetum coccineum]
MTRKSFPHHPKGATDLLGIVHIDVCGPLRHVSRQGASYFITFMDDYSHYGYVYLLKHKHEVWGCEALVKWDTLEKLQQRSVKCIFIGYPKETMVSGRAIDLEEIQDEDTSPSEITSEIPIEVEGFEPPQEEVILIRRSERTHRAPNQLCLNVEAEEHSLGDLNEPTSYKAAMYLKEYKDMFMGLWWNPEAELGAHDWKSSKQSTTAMSATEAEYIAASEAVWIRKFISGLGIVPTINEPIRMFCDNSTALHFANEPGVQRGARHYHRKISLCA